MEAGGAQSHFWEVNSGGWGGPVVWDSGRRRQVAAENRGHSSGGAVRGLGLGAVDATLRSLNEDMQRAAAVAASSIAVARGGRRSPVPEGGDWSPAACSVAELSDRRREAIKAAFRRIDPAMRGWAAMQDALVGLQRFGSLTPAEQSQVLHAISSGQGPQASGRITFTAFAAYYQRVGASIEFDRDFEDLLRRHWGFSEVSDIMDDMKNKFAMVGLAYTFRESFQHEVAPEISSQAFKDAITKVGIEYGSSEVQRLFDAFECGSVLPILRLIQHLSSAPRPPTPIVSLNGLSHFGEPPMTGYPQPAPAAAAGAWPGGAPGVAQHAPAFGAAPHGAAPHGASGIRAHASVHDAHKLDEPVPAPHDDHDAAPEERPAAVRRHHLPDGVEPPHEEDDSMPHAPPETHEAPVEAPPDDDDDEAPLAPPEEPPMGSRAIDISEVDPRHGAYAKLYHAPQMAPAEQAPPSSWGSPSRYGQGGRYGHHGHVAQYGHTGRPQQVGAGMSGGSSPSRPYCHPCFGPPKQQSPMAMAPAVSLDTGSGSQEGRKRAVTIGINYIGTQFQLNGCINDSDTFIGLLTEEFGYHVSDIRQLRDDHPQRMPTRKNMVAAMKWLVSGARAGDHLFLHYSGHGSQTEDTDGDELDGKDEALVPVDFRQGGMISDDDLRRILVQDLPKDCRLTVILDCCHSGTALDLPYRVIASEAGLDVKKKPSHKLPRPAAGEVVLLSGCQDDQTSADAGTGLAGNKAPAGAMTTAFKVAIMKRPTASYHEVLEEMRGFLKAQRFTQVPQLSTEHFLKLSECFMPEAQRRAQAQLQAAPAPTRAPVRKALTVGINYYCLPKDKGQLSGCINDSDTMMGILHDTFDFTPNEICRLRDDRHDMMPTRANLLASLRWLTQGAAAGDELFFHYSGHGGQVEDKNGDEEGGKDSTLIPCDFMQSGMITDDDLYALVVAPLPAGVRLWVMMDCCHSGTALDLPYKVDIQPNGNSLRLVKRDIKRGGVPESKAEVVMISGCKDSQTSADVQALAAQKSAGAMTTAFRSCVSRSITCEDLLIKMRDYLRRHRYVQVPQMSSEQYVQLDAPFVAYAATPKKSRDIGAFAAPSGAMAPTPASQAQSYSPTPQGPSALPGQVGASVSPMRHTVPTRMGASARAEDPMRTTSPVRGASPLRAHSPMGHSSPMRSASPMQQMYAPQYYPQLGSPARYGGSPYQQGPTMDEAARITHLEQQITELKRARSPMHGGAPAYGMRQW